MDMQQNCLFRELTSQLLSPVKTLESLKEGITISDPHQPDNPVVYANESFLQLTGYTLNEVLYRNCRFLQGEDTDPNAVAEVRQALLRGEKLTIDLVNYRKDGKRFWNQMTISPIRSIAGDITHFIAIQRDVTAYRQLQEQHQVSVEALQASLALLRQRIREQEETIAAFIMQTDASPRRP